MANRKLVMAIVSVVFVLVLGPKSSFSGDKKDMGGWEVDGQYNQFYKSSERDRLKGVVTEFTEVVPLDGMSPGVALILKDEDGDRVVVHLGPEWFVDPKSIGIRKGDKVKIKGAWAVIGDEDVFIAAKLKRSEFDEYKIRRTKDGFPFWCMSAEELARERAGD